MVKNNKRYRVIGMLAHSFYPHDVRVRREAETLAAEGFEVHIVCIRSSNMAENVNEKAYEILNGVHIHRMPINRKRGGMPRYFFEFMSMTFLGALELLKIHNRRKLDAIHIHNMPDILIFSGIIPKITGVRLVLDVHDPMSELYQANYHVDAENPIIKVIKLQERLCYRLTDSLITVSHTMAENVSEKSGRPIKDIQVVHNFPNLEMFSVFSDIKKWPRKKDSFDILYAGTITEHYSLSTAIKAVAIAAKDIPNIHLRIVGDGNRVDEVLNLAEELGVSDRIEYMESVRHELVKGLMAETDIGISTHSDGAFGRLYFSNKIIEYMTQGLAVIASRTRTFEKYLPEDTVFYFEPENEADMAVQMVFMYKNPEIVLQKIKKGKNLIAKYNWQKEKANLVDFYKGFFE